MFKYNKASYERFKYYSNQRKNQLERIKLEVFFKSVKKHKKATRGYDGLDR